MKFEVILDKWGNYKKGDVLEMHPSTGNACKKAVKPFKEKSKRNTK